jgi:hypothetical protein
VRIGITIAALVASPTSSAENYTTNPLEIGWPKQHVALTSLFSESNRFRSSMEVSRSAHTSSRVRDLHFGFPQRSHNLTYDLRGGFDKSWMGIGAPVQAGVQLQTQLQ